MTAPRNSSSVLASSSLKSVRYPIPVLRVTTTSTPEDRNCGKILSQHQSGAYSGNTTPSESTLPDAPIGLSGKGAHLSQPQGLVPPNDSRNDLSHQPLHP